MKVRTRLAGALVLLVPALTVSGLVPASAAPSDAASVTLTPATATNLVGTGHTVTATVRDAGGSPVDQANVQFTVTGAMNLNGNCTTHADGQCTFSYYGPLSPGEDTIEGCVLDANGGSTGLCGAATKVWVGPSTLTLSPATATNPVSTEHTVTATATIPGGTPVPGQYVAFTVSGAMNLNGNCTTHADGKCTFTYTGPTSPGTDTILGCVQYPNGDPSGPCDEATKNWVGPSSLTLTPKTATNPVSTAHTITATARFPSEAPAPNQSVQFTITGVTSTSGINGTCNDAATGTTHTTDANGQCTFTYVGPSTPGIDTITGCIDNNGNGTIEPTEPCDTVTKRWGAPSSVTLTPPDATNTVGTSHTVTASVRFSDEAAASGYAVLFGVQGASSKSGTCNTDASGQCGFSYQGPDLPGADLITACVDNDGNGQHDPGEPCSTATKAWVLPTTTPGQVTGGGGVANSTGTDAIAFGFNAKSDSKGVKGECNLVDPSSSTKVKCLDVTTLVTSGTHATLFGHATVNGAATTYRIDVDDLAEPGRGKDTFKIHTDSGYTAGGVLTGGNIQAH